MTNLEFAGKLRELAEVYEKHPEIRQPYHVGMTLRDIEKALQSEDRAPMRRYVGTGIPPWQFLEAALSKEMTAAFRAGDVFEIAAFLYLVQEGSRKSGALGVAV